MSPAAFVCQSIELGGKVISLTARTVQQYICEWHLVSFVNAIFLGAPRKAIQAISEKLGKAGESVDAEQIINSIDRTMVQAIPPLKVFTSQCNVAVTDLVFNHVSGSRRFGIGLQIHDNNRLGPVTIDGVAILVKLTPQQKENT